jgi:hypothetical protein
MVEMIDLGELLDGNHDECQLYREALVALNAIGFRLAGNG